MQDFLSYFGLLCGDRHWGLDGGCTLSWRIMQGWRGGERRVEVWPGEAETETVGLAPFFV